MDRKFLVCMLVVFVLSLAARTIALGSIHQVVFDEVHFGKFISSYSATHTRFFDIHPPIGKLLIAGGAYLAGYNGQFSFDHIGQPYGDVPIGAIRMVPAFFGALLPLIIMILLRQAGVSLAVSFIGGIAVALDNALIVESRYILTDSILLTALFGCIAATIAAVQIKNKSYSWCLVMLAGVLAGVGVGTKFTGAIGGALAVWILLSQAIRTRYMESSTWIWKMLLLAIFAIATYLMGWMVHFSLLTLPGSGDAWGIPTGSFWPDLIRAHEQMLSANYNLTAGHPYGSKWWTWPFMARSVFYWQGNGPAFVYLLGNPVVWWGSFCLFVSGVIALFFATLGRGRDASIAWVFLFGFAGSFLPLIRVPRVLFLYHYLTPLIFSLLFGLYWLHHVVGSKKSLVVACSLALIVAGFLFISPLTYGLGISQEWQHVLFFIPSWR